MRPVVFILWAVVLPASARGGMDGAEPPAPTETSFIPAAWGEFAIDWKPTWEQTLAACKPGEWLGQLQQDPKLRFAARQIAGVRAVRLYEAMMERWPKDEGLRRAAYRGIAEAWGQAGDSWRRSWWTWKFIREFKPAGEELADAYQEMTAGAYYASDTIPRTRDWAFGLREVLLLAEAGRIPDGHKVVAQAGANLAILLGNEERYDELAALLERLKGLGPRYGGAYAAVGQTLQRFGHAGPAGEYFRKAGNEQAFAALSPVEQGAVYGLPREEQLEAHLEAMSRGRSLATDLGAGRTGAIQDLLDAAARTRATVSGGDYSRATSAWGTLDGLLQTLAPEHRAVLARAQQRAAGPVVGALRQAGDPQRLLAAFRRYPFAVELQQLLLETGEAALRDGRTHWAIACFRDVLDHATADATRNQARVGLWLSLAQDAGAGEQLRRALQLVGDDEMLAWGGEAAPAGRVKRRVLAAEPATATTRTAESWRIEVPADWPAGAPSRQGGYFDAAPVRGLLQPGEDLYVTGLGHLARYRRGRPRCLWQTAAPAASQTPVAMPPVREGNPPPPYVLRPTTARSLPASAADGPVPCLHETNDGPDVSGVDALTGRTLWSTAARAEWAGRLPVTTPVAADGYLYLLARAPQSELQLLCLAGEDGRILWTTSLGWRLDEKLWQLAQGAPAVTVHQGSVYCNTNMGLALRCDARDGMVAWVVGYASAFSGDSRAPQRSRGGEGPLVLDEAVCLAPRDHTGLIALDQTTGKGLWETPLVPAARIVGAAGDVVVTAARHWLAATDRHTGRRLWVRRVDASARPGSGQAGDAQAVLVGEELLALDAGELLQLDPRTGKPLTRRLVPADPDSETLLLPDGRLLEVASAPLPADRLQAPDNGEPLLLPFPAPVLIPSGDAPADNAGAVCFLSGRRLVCLATRPTLRLAWQRLLADPPVAAHPHGGLILLVAGRRVEAVNVADGKERWAIDLPFHARFFAGDETLLIAGSSPEFYAPHAAAIDPASGTLLWQRSYNDRAFFSFDRGLRGLSFRRTPGAKPALSLQLHALYADVGWTPVAVAVNPADGAVLDVQRARDVAVNWPENTARRGQAVLTLFKDSALSARANLVSGEDGKDLAPNWHPRLSLHPAELYPGVIGVRLTDTDAWVRTFGLLLRYDRAAGKETVFRLPKPPFQTVVDILDYRPDPAGKTLAVVSGLRAEYLPANRRTRRDLKYADVPTAIHLDTFDLATAKHLGRRRLGNLPCHSANQDGYRTTAHVTSAALLITTPAGISLFPAGTR